MSALLRAPVMRWWLRDPVERAVFRLTLAGLARARGVKLRVYPVLGQFLAYPLIIFFTGSPLRSGGGVHAYVVACAGAFVAMLPAIIMDRLRMADDWRAAELFHQAPLPRIAAIFHGVRKAVVLVLCVPGIAIVAGLGLVWSRDPAELLLLLPGILMVPVFSLLPGLGRLFLPFAEAPEVQMKDALGCILLMVFMMSAFALGGISGWAWSHGWFGRMLAAEAVIAAVLAVVLHRIIAARVLRAER